MAFVDHKGGYVFTGKCVCWGGGWAGASEGWVAGRILIINFYAGPCFYFGEDEKESSFFGMP